MSISVAQVRGLEAKLWEANDTIYDLEILIKSHEEEIAKTGVMIDTVMEALRSSGAPASSPDN